MTRFQGAYPLREQPYDVQVKYQRPPDLSKPLRGSYHCSSCGRGGIGRTQHAIGGLGLCRECLAARRASVKRALAGRRQETVQRPLRDISEQLGRR